jgi:hypothetical protein
MNEKNTPTRLRGPDGEVYMQVELEDMTKEQLIEAIDDRPDDYVALRQEETGASVLIPGRDFKVDYEPYELDEEDKEDAA